MKIYYHIKPFIPRRVQIFLRRRIAMRKRQMTADIWPIDRSAAGPPRGWHGWPDGKRFAFILTHDVEGQRGHDKCHQLSQLEESMGFRSSYNFVPGDYRVVADLRTDLAARNFEVGVHGYTHDGTLYRSRETFRSQALQINRVLKEWDAVGFRSPAMYHNLEWIHDLDIEYDASTFDTDPFEPQPDGIGTIFPFVVTGNNGKKGYVELPYTLPQDFTLFVIMKEKNIDIWKAKLDWIAQHRGMALLITHPDYMSFNGTPLAADEYPAELYREFLEYVATSYAGDYWHALPRQVAGHMW